MTASNATLVRVIREKILSRRLQPGTWNFFHPSAKTPVDCPYGTISCGGSQAASINFTTSLVHQLINEDDIGLLSDEAYCNEHFSGALCSQSSSGYYIDWTSHQSLACQDGASSSLFRSFMLCIPLALVLPIIICFTIGKTYKKCNKRSDTQKVAGAQNAFSMTIHTLLSADATFHAKKRTVVACCTKSQYDLCADSNLRPSPMVLKTTGTKGNSVDNSFCNSFDIHNIASRDLEFGPTNDSLPTKMKVEVKPLPENIQWREKHFQQTRQSYWALGYLFKIKILVLSLQLTASLPSSIGVSYLPPVIASVLRVYSNISLVSLQAMIPTDCLGSLLGVGRLNLFILLQIASSVPLMLLAALLAGYLFQTEFAFLNGVLGRHYRDNLSRMALRYSTVAWMMVIILVAGVGQLALKCFTCVDIDPDRIFSAGTHVLWNDPTVLCSDSNYNIGVVWATTASFTYILGVPLVMWVVLRYTGYDRLPNTISGSNETVVDTGSITSRVSSIHDRYVDRTWKLDFSPSAYLNDSYALLHLSYKRSCKYWELLETVYRILVIAVLPYFTQQSGPAAHLFGIGITALVYALALWWFAPYNNKVNQTLAVMSSCQVLCFFIILLAIVVVGESEGDGVDGEVFLDLSMCVVALVTPSLVLYQLLRSAYMSYHGKTDPKYNTTIDLQFVPRDSDPRVSVTQSVKSDIESVNGAPSVKEKDCEEKIIDKEDNDVYSFSDSSDDDNDTAAVTDRNSGRKGRHGEPRSSKRKDRGENDINFDSESNSVDGRREPTVVEHGSGRRTALEERSATRVSLTVSGSSNYHSINISEVRFVSGRQSFERAVNDRVISKRCSGIDCDGTCSGPGVLLLSDRGDVKYGAAFRMKRSAIEDDVNLIPIEGDILCTSESSSNHIRSRPRVDEKDHERRHVQKVVNGGAEADSPWFSLKKSTKDLTACNDDDGDGGEVSNPSGQLVVESGERSKKNPIIAYFNPFGAWNEKGMKSPTPLFTSPAASSRKKALKAPTSTPTPTSTSIQSPSGVRSMKHFFSNDRIEHVIEDGATLCAAEGGLVGTGKKKDRLRVDAKGSERGFVQRVINGSDENISPWFSLKKSTRESAPCDDEVDGDDVGYGLEDIYPSRKIAVDVEGQNKRKPITAYFNPFGAWSEKDVKSSVTPPTDPLVSSAASIAKAQNSAEIVRTAKQLFSRALDRKERNREEDGATGCAAERGLVGLSETDTSHVRRARDRRRVDEKDHERGIVQRIVAGGVEDDSPWFSLKKSTIDTIICDNEEDGGEGDDGEVSNPSGQIVIESEERSKKKPITAFFNPFGAWNEKDLKSPIPVSTSPVANSPKKAAKAQTPTSKRRGIEKWASGARTVKQPSSDSLDNCGTVDRDVTAVLGEVGLDDQGEEDSNHIRQKRDFHRVAHKDYERGYVHLVVNGGEEDDNPWFSLKKSPRKMAAGDDKEEEYDSDDGAINILARQKSPSRQVVVESETLIKKKPVTANFNPLGAWNEMDLKSYTPMPKTRTSASPRASSPRKTIAKVQVPTAKAKDTVKWASEVHTAMDPISDDDDSNELPASMARNRHRRRYSIPNNFKLLQDTGVDARHIKRNASSSSFIL